MRPEPSTKRYGVYLPKRPFPIYHDSQLTPVSAYEWGPPTFRTSLSDPTKPPGNSSVRGPTGSGLDPTQLRGPTSWAGGSSQATGSQCFEDSSISQGWQGHFTEANLDKSEYNKGTSYESMKQEGSHGTGPGWLQRSLPQQPLVSTPIHTSSSQQNVQDRAWLLTDSLNTESEEQLLLQHLSLMQIPDDLTHQSMNLVKSDPGM